MTDYAIPCEVIARLSILANDTPADADQRFKSLRYDNGLLIASNNRLIAVENITGPAGVFHLVLDPALVAQCRTEAPFKSVLHVTLNDMLQFASGKTTLGYSHPANCTLWNSPASKFDSWRDIVARVVDPANEPNGGMYWKAQEIALLAATAPSGSVIFERVVDVNRPAIIRDPFDENWFAMFNPWNKDLETAPPATLPGWYK